MFTNFKFKGLLLAPFILLLLNVDIFAEPLRIISLTPAITKQLIVLGEKDNIVGCTSFCSLAKDKSSKAQIVGSAISANIESIVNLKPDIVFVSSLTNIKIINKLKSLSIRVENFSYPVSVEEIFESFLRLSEIVKKTQIAENIVKSSKDKLRKIVETYKTYNLKKVFFEIGADPLFGTPKGTYLADVLTKLNAINISEYLKQGQISKEWIIRGNPDVILIMDMGAIATQEVKNWGKFKTLSAVKNGKIFILDADRLASPILPDFIQLINEIGGLIHK